MLTCQLCKTDFEWTDADEALLNKLTPVIAGKKLILPPPSLCWDCHCQHIWCFRNQYQFYKRKSSRSDRQMVSLYSPDKPDIVYTHDEWWVNDWDATDYSREFDFSRPFFEQFNELLKEVPKITLIQDGTSENCDYTNFGSENKNCYLATVFRCEDVYYGQAFLSKDCVDCHNIMRGEKLYECIDCIGGYNSAYLQDCTNCLDSWFLDSCTDCKNCLGCKNLKHKQYYIFNEPYSKEEYKKKFTELMANGLSAFRKKFDEWKLKFPFRFAWHRNCENSEGNLLNGSKDCYYCFDTFEGAQDCRYSLIIGLNAHDILYSHNAAGELNYQIDGMLGARHVYFSHFLRYCSESFYSMYCYNSQNLFGCTGLNRKQYCILNKQYSKDDYETLVPKIVEHMRKTNEWGQYFPSTISPFGYNESLAFEYQSLTKKEAIDKGFNWCDYQVSTEAVKVIPAKNLPDKIEEVPDNILKWAISCEVTDKLFKLIPQELQFYRRHNLPVPRRHPDQRRRDRMKRRLPYHLWKRKCDKCATNIMTGYSAERPEIIYCKKCYLQSIY